MNTISRDRTPERGEREPSARARENLVHGLVELQAEATPGALALECAGTQLTYRALDRRANQVAHRLRTLGVGPESLVGICLERSAGMLVGLLGTLKAGGAYVPLDPAYPQDRLAFMLEDSRARVLLTQSRLVEKLSSFTGDVVVLDSEPAGAEGESEQAPRSGVTPENLAYVIYTSGSTGKPKGVMLAHGGVAALFRWTVEAFTEEEFSAVFASTSVCFDISVFELFFPLARGGKVVLGENAFALPGAAASSVTLVNTVPSAMAELARTGRLPGSVRTVNMAGEALPRAVVQKIFARGAVERVWNLYGPTETTVYSIGGIVDPDGSGPPSIGRAIAGNRLSIVDGRFREVADDVPGELYIGGGAVARGYLGRPDLTAERFLPNPFGPAGSRVYRTGDIVCRRRGGEIDFLGRSDHQVKVRGFRIELREIEHALLAHASVREAAVVAREDTPGETRLVAYLAFEKGAVPLRGELREHLARSLPEYMVPSLFIPLGSLPRTLNGKVDRKALPAPSETRGEMSSSFVAPRDAVERKLAGLWEEILHVRPIGARDDFFELGGNSIHAARLFSRLETAFRRDLPPTTLFKATTVEDLARILAQRPEASRWKSLVPIQPEGSRPPLFGIHGGAGTILFFQGLARHLGPDQPTYGLQARGLYGEAPPHRHIEQMAAYYVREVRDLQPRGPYYLVGFCSGGLVAYEMARLLRSEGEEIALLGGINAMGPANPTLPGHRPSPAGTLESRISGHRRASHSMGPARKLLYYGLAAARSARSRSRNLLRKLRIEALIAARRPLPESLREGFFLSIADRAVAEYVPREIHPGPLVHFRAESIPSEPEYLDPQLGWTGYAGDGLEIHVVPGVHAGHRTIMDDPAVRILGSQLSEVLRRCQESAGSVGARRAARGRG